ncbi:hypothetical protein ELG76_04130 [Rhizobium leguminosarum]|uniref:hypothetical protein n=1 Tax=Rhizobium leguminosarum TaxID=384 RepID=UPI001030BB58|nr:hypothetical protein [Rhizobium leguminosarum]TBG78608.1 hypothetical protein ELG76_04130 [Rhizobium leguminosarum]
MRAKRGDPMRFIHEVALQHTGDECLIWPFGKDKNGYGKIRICDKTAVASRYVCELVRGPSPTPEHEAGHSCGKGHEGCIAPDHLDWKTHAENEADKLEHGTLKLTEAAVREIVSLRGKETQGKLAERFGVAQTTVSRIHIGRSWAWVNH